MKTIACAGILACLLPTSPSRVSAVEPPDKTFDVVVYGGTAPAITTAVRCAREGLQVALVSPTPQLGGSLPSLGAVETHYRGVRAPLLQEFCERVKKHYRERYGADSDQYRACTGGSMITFEPHVAENVLTTLVNDESQIQVFRGYVPVNVERDGRLIRTVSFQGATGGKMLHMKASAFVEASYEGDLMTLAGAESRVGREGRAEFDEPRAGRVFTHWLRGRYPRAAVEGNLNLVTARATTSEPIEGSTGAGDDNIQSYSFRLCLTDDPANQLQLDKPPPDYDRERYAPILLSPAEKERVPLPFHHRFVIYSLREMVEMDHVFHGHALPNRKRSWNATNFTGAGKRYPTATWSERGDIKRRHLEFALGLLYFLQHDSDMPDDIRVQAQKWGLARDEFATTDNLPPQLYVREARRLKGRKLFTEHDALVAPGLERAPLHSDAIGITEFSLDSLACTTDRLPGSLCDGQLFQMEVSRPGQVSFGVLFSGDLDNLMVATTVSATHVGWGTIRQTPTLMHLAESAAWAIVLAARARICPVDMDVNRLQRHLVEHGVMVSFFNDLDMAGREPYVPAVQYLGARGFFSSYDAAPGKPLTPAVARQWARTFGRMMANELDPNLEARNLRKIGDGEGTLTLKEFAGMLRTELSGQGAAIRELDEAIRKLEVNADAPLNRATACQLMYQAGS